MVKKKKPAKAKVIVPDIVTDDVTTGLATNKLPSTTDPLSLYLAEVSKYPLLSREEEHELAVKYFESKDPEAAEKLVTSNLRFVVSVAAEFSKFGAKMIDLVQEGNVGLMHAVREFNPYKGVKLITYAVWWIKGYIREYLLRQYSVVRIGTSAEQKKLFYQLQKEQRKLEALGQELDVALLSSRLGVDESAVEDMQKRLNSRDVSLDQPLDVDSNGTVIDIQKNEVVRPIDEELSKLEETELLKSKIDTVRKELNDKEIYILENRLLSDDPKTLQEIGDYFGITRERARQIESKIISKLKDQWA
ncbi:MAG: RNA polymerase factor sigma-32 [Bdellovibrionales bacterium]|nr:RNA polymerase factor sigma-32 [Bdellovibrionales bacterium]